MDLQKMIGQIADDITANAAKLESEADAKDETAKPGPFGIAIATADGVISAGTADTLFPIQSISKVFALDLALRAYGDTVFERVGREPSGDPFNSVIDLERTHGIPRNPFINAGALVVVDMLVETHASEDAVVDLVREEIEGRQIELNDDVLTEGGHLNRAMLSFMKHHDNINAPIEEVLQSYAKQCAISVDCGGLARAGLFLSRTRLHHDNKEEAERARRMRKVLALMMTCGHYDGSGDFAVRVGLPAKSGVGGGILAVAPERASIAVWSPNLDQHGNSILGVRALEMFAARSGWSVFGPAIA
jgi:glutaminase